MSKNESVVAIAKSNDDRRFWVVLSWCCVVAIALAAIIAPVATAASAESSGWMGFRGDGSGAAVDGPETLDTGEGGNLAWKVPMPGRSVAGAIVVGDLVVTTSSAGPDGGRLFVTGVDLKTGEVRWEQSFRSTGRPFCHPTSANAAPTPVSDGENVIAFFSSNDLVCLSTRGDLIWYRGLGFDHPKAGNDVGMASSPIIAEDAVIVQIECKGDSFATGIDLKTGEDLWRIDRPKSSNWSSPLPIDRADGTVEVVMQCGTDVVAVDPRTGQSRWKLDEGRATVPSPTLSGDYLMLPGDDLLVMKINDSGSAPDEAWRSGSFSPRNASVVASKDRLYALKGSVLVAGMIETGDRLWQERLSGLSGGYATPAVAGNRIYVFDQSGNGAIIEDSGDDAEIIAEVSLEESVLASPALADGKLIVRGVDHLFCFE